MIYITSCQRFEEHIDSQLIYVVMLMELWEEGWNYGGRGRRWGESTPYRISSKCSSNSEAKASELLEHFEEIAKCNI